MTNKEYYFPFNLYCYYYNQVTNLIPRRIQIKRKDLRVLINNNIIISACAAKQCIDKTGRKCN